MLRRIPSAKCEGVGLDAGVEKLDLEHAIPDLAGLADQLVQPFAVYDAPATGIDVGAVSFPGAAPSIVTRKRIGSPDFPGPSTRCRSRAWKR